MITKPTVDRHPRTGDQRDFSRNRFLRTQPGSSLELHPAGKSPAAGAGGRLVLHRRRRHFAALAVSAARDQIRPLRQAVSAGLHHLHGQQRLSAAQRRNPAGRPAPARRERPARRGGTVVVTERIFDGIVMLTFVIVSLALLNVASPELRSGRARSPRRSSSSPCWFLRAGAQTEHPAPPDRAGQPDTARASLARWRSSWAKK